MLIPAGQSPDNVNVFQALYGLVLEPDTACFPLISETQQVIQHAELVQVRSIDPCYEETAGHPIGWLVGVGLTPEATTVL